MEEKVRKYRERLDQIDNLKETNQVKLKQQQNV